MARLPITTETLSPLSPDIKIVLNAESIGLTPEQFFRLCSDNPELQFELTARKEIIIMPPEGGETGARTFETLTHAATVGITLVPVPQEGGLSDSCNNIFVVLNS